MATLSELSPRRLTFLIIGLPLALALVYYVVFAADRYVSEFVVTVGEVSDRSNAGSGLALFIPGASPPARQETLYLREYVHSLDLLKHLDEKLGVRAAYGVAPLDIFYNLFSWASQEWFLDYFRSRVQVSFDEVSSLLTVRVQAFEPGKAEAIAREILSKSEQFVNEFSRRMAREQMTFAETELGNARERFQAAKEAIIAFQERHDILDPTAEAQATVSLTSGFEAEISRLEAELRNLQSYLKDNAHEVVSLQNKIAALRVQLEIERANSVASDGNRINTLAAEFQNLGLHVAFAEDAYKVALTAVENARVEAGRNLKSLIVVQSPTLPETAVYPRRLYNLASLAILLTLLYGIARLSLATIRDHQD